MSHSLGTVVEGLEQRIGLSRERLSGLLRVDEHTFAIFGLRAEPDGDLEVSGLAGVSVVVVDEFTRQNFLDLGDESVCVGFVSSATAVLNLD